jgi:hypothetical protein
MDKQMLHPNWGTSDLGNLKMAVKQQKKKPR